MTTLMRVLGQGPKPYINQTPANVFRTNLTLHVSMRHLFSNCCKSGFRNRRGNNTLGGFSLFNSLSKRTLFTKANRPHSVRGTTQSRPFWSSFTFRRVFLTSSIRQCAKAAKSAKSKPKFSEIKKLLALAKPEKWTVAGKYRCELSFE